MKKQSQFNLIFPLIFHNSSKTRKILLAYQHISKIFMVYTPSNLSLFAKQNTSNIYTNCTDRLTYLRNETLLANFNSLIAIKSSAKERKPARQVHETLYVSIYFTPGTNSFRCRRLSRHLRTPEAVPIIAHFERHKWNSFSVMDL